MTDTAARAKSKIHTEQFLESLDSRCTDCRFEFCPGEFSAQGNLLGLITGGKDSVMSDFAEPGRQNVQQSGNIVSHGRLCLELGII